MKNKAITANLYRIKIKVGNNQYLEFSVDSFRHFKRLFDYVWGNTTIEWITVNGQKSSKFPSSDKLKYLFD